MNEEAVSKEVMKIAEYMSEQVSLEADEKRRMTFHFEITVERKMKRKKTIKIDSIKMYEEGQMSEAATKCMEIIAQIRKKQAELKAMM